MYFCIVKSISHCKMLVGIMYFIVVVRVIHHESGQFKINNSSVTKTDVYAEIRCGRKFLLSLELASQSQLEG